MDFPDFQGRNLSDLCRCCLTESESMTHLVSATEKTPTYCSKLQFLFQFEPDNDENAPQFICKLCIQKLETSYGFRQLLTNSTEIVQKNLEESKRQPPEDPSSDNEIEIVYLESECDTPKNRASKKSTSSFDPEVVEEAIQRVKAQFVNNRQCIQCDFVGANGHCLAMHMKFIHKDLKLMWCPTCNNLVDDLAEHAKATHAPRKLCCEFCQKPFNLAGRLIEHIKRHSNDRPYKCRICHGGYISDRLLKNHLSRAHNDESIQNNPVYKCQNCDTTFLDAKSLEKHMNDMCQKEEGDTGIPQQELHKSTNKKPSKVLCTVCGKQLSNGSKLRVHMRSHTNSRPYVCSYCPQKFTARNYKVLHERTHTGEKPHVCDICGSAFSQSSILATHMKLHTGKPHQCEICEKRFCRAVELRLHMRQHTGEKPFVCTVCGNGFKQRSHLAEHARIHSDSRPFKCQFCSKGFSQKSTLKTHERIHLGSKPFQCDQCLYACRQSYSLTLHMRRHSKRTET